MYQDRTCEERRLPSLLRPASFTRPVITLLAARQGVVVVAVAERVEAAAGADTRRAHRLVAEFVAVAGARPGECGRCE
ncbi:hypothetical protein SNE510_75830 [Streptomyces sp. NE5-10]|nr:hypothetical protein SNE510_75830 [Streptomyces sp. NE5-10]